MNRWWTTEWPGVGQDPQKASAAESDTTFREAFVVGGYQAPEGDTETPYFCFLPLQVDWRQYRALPLTTYPSVVAGAGALLRDLVQSSFAPAASLRVLDGPRESVFVFDAPAQAGTAGLRPDPSQEQLERHVRAVLEAAREEHFEDGMESPFSQELVHLIRKYGKVGAAELGGLIVHRVIDDDVASEALRWIGLMVDASAVSHKVV